MRFTPKSNPTKTLIGEPTDPQIDVGLALYQGKDVSVRPFSGHSVLNPGQKSETTENIGRLLSPLAQSEVGSIRCIGLNVSCVRQRKTSPCSREGHSTDRTLPR